ncbi:MAG: hypothetical protein ABI134_25000 [Byssovorax sp.]
MRTPGACSLSRAARSGVSTLLALLLVSGGCTFLVGAQLSDKPEEATGAGGGGGQGGAAATTTSAQTTSGPSGGSSSSGDTTTSVASGMNVGVGTSVSSSAGSGGMMCSTDLADCDGKPENGCETNIKTDPKNCGSCLHKCAKSQSCKESKCN